MRIFYYALEYPTPMYLWQRQHHIGELEAAGHEIIRFNPADWPDMDTANTEAAKALREAGHVDLFMTCDDQDTVYPGTLLEASRLGIPTLLICWDNLELPHKQKRLARVADLVWLLSWETQYLFEKWGAKDIIFMPYAANPLTYKPVDTPEVIPTVGFIGSPYASRANVLNGLLDAGVECTVCSNALFDSGFNSSTPDRKTHFDPIDLAVKASRYMRFPIGRKVFLAAVLNKFHRGSRLTAPRQGLTAMRSVDHAEMCRLYSSFALSLNIPELRDTYILKHPIPKLHLRTFEIPMCGGLQLMSRVPEVEQYFVDGEEIVLYSSQEELIDKARHYLDPRHAAEVHRMREAARARALSDHTWTHRFTRIFNRLGIG